MPLGTDSRIYVCVAPTEIFSSFLQAAPKKDGGNYSFGPLPCDLSVPRTFQRNPEYPEDRTTLFASPGKARGLRASAARAVVVRRQHVVVLGSRK